MVEESIAHEFNHQARVLLVVIESQVGQALNIAFFVEVTAGILRTNELFLRIPT